MAEFDCRIIIFQEYACNKTLMPYNNADAGSLKGHLARAT